MFGTKNTQLCTWILERVLIDLSQFWDWFWDQKYSKMLPRGGPGDVREGSGMPLGGGFWKNMKKKKTCFLPYFNPRWCQKATRKIQYGDFLAPSGGQNAKKTSFGRCFENTRNVDENSKRKSKVFDGSEARLALYSSLISHFRHSLKNIELLMEKETKMMPKSMPKS